MKKNRDLEIEYIMLFPNHESFKNVQEWKEEGDYIQEFTMFEDYPPAYSSCDTILSE